MCVLGRNALAPWQLRAMNVCVHVHVVGCGQHRTPLCVGTYVRLQLHACLHESHGLSDWLVMLGMLGIE